MGTGGLEAELGHGGVDLGTGLGAAVLGLTGLDAGVSGAGLDGLAVHKLGGVNLGNKQLLIISAQHSYYNIYVLVSY